MRSGPGNDQLLGGAGSDSANGGTGNDTIDGGAGVDTARFSGQRSAYQLVNLGAGQVRVSGPDGTDSVRGVERLQFDNGTYSVPTTLLSQNVTLALNSFGSSDAAGGWSSGDLYPRTAADINGDGRADLIGFGSAGVFASLATGSGQFGAVSLVYNSFGSSAAAGGWSSDNAYPRTLADLNGDGRADLVGFGGAGVYAALANAGGGFGNVFLALNSFGQDAAAGGWVNNTTFPRTTGDINGDGFADLVGFGGAGVYAALGIGNGQFGNVFLAFNSFGTDAAAGGWTNDNAYPRLLADVNGDGRDDLVGFGGAGVYVALATGGGGFGPVSLALNSFGQSDAGGGWSNNDLYPRLLADLNGDGAADIIGFGGAGVFAALANGDGTFAAASLALNSFGASAAGGGWSSDGLYPRLAADVTGDGLADIIGFGGAGVYLAPANDFVFVP